MRRIISTSLALIVIATGCSGDDGAASVPDPTTTAPTSSTAAPGTSTDATPPATTTPTETTAPATTVVTMGDTTVEVATINVLHGLIPPISGCAESTDQCNAPARVDILWNYLATDVGCPDIIALQEIALRWFELVPEKLPELCDGDYVLLTEDLGLFDQEMILTTLPVIDEGRVELAGAPVWSAHWAQLDAGDGLTVDVFGTHYASSSFDPPCSPDAPATTCHPSCPADSDLGDCHPYETLAFLDERAAPGSLQLVVGDLNRQLDEPRIQTLIEAGFIDTHLAAGNAECPAGGGLGCTSGIGDDDASDYAGLDIADWTPRGRIDFVLARPPAGCELLVDIDDADGDGTHTGVWADRPLDQPYEGLYWGSDHAGIQADVGVTC